MKKSGSGCSLGLFAFYGGLGVAAFQNSEGNLKKYKKKTKKNIKNNDFFSIFLF
jgi:hypothetical protein